MTKSPRFLRIWSHLLKKSLMENFIFSVVIVNFQVSVSFLILTLTILENCKVKTVSLLNKPASLRRYFCFLKETTAFNFNQYQEACKSLTFFTKMFHSTLLTAKQWFNFVGVPSLLKKMFPTVFLQSNNLTVNCTIWVGKWISIVALMITLIFEGIPRGFQPSYINERTFCIM